MLASFLLSLREGLEAALIIAIVLGVLLRLDRRDLGRSVWAGVLSAAAVSLLAAAALNLLGMEFSGRSEEIFEGTAMLLAAAVLTWMVLWMQQAAGSLKHEIEQKTRAAVAGQGGLFMLAFLAVLREGIELALFLLAVQRTASPAETLLGALAGLAASAGLGWLLFRSSRRISLRGFFRVTNVLLIILAAGLVAHGVHEFNEAGLIPVLVEHVWDVNHILDENGQVGLLLKALVGYNGNPSATEVMAYFIYLGAVSFYVSTRRAPAPLAAGAAG